MTPDCTEKDIPEEQQALVSFEMQDEQLYWKKIIYMPEKYHAEPLGYRIRYIIHTITIRNRRPVSWCATPR